jgi:nucleotidyltransferase substrate binding protein (TIGR01987 family)
VFQKPGFRKKRNFKALLLRGDPWLPYPSKLNKAVDSLLEAHALYQKNPEGSAEKKAFRDACIQRFEFCVEFSWKVSMKALGSQTQAAKPAVREMGRNGLVSDVAEWLDYIEARNETSHSYDEEVAKKVYTVFLALF